jgi:hypothetical protein
MVGIQCLECFIQRLSCICSHALEPDTSTFRDNPHEIGCGEVDQILKQTTNHIQPNHFSFKVSPLQGSESLKMGSFFSSPTPPPLSEKPATSQPRHFPYYNNPVPAEASTAPEDSQTWYTDFYEKAYVAPHRDGQNLIICRPLWRADGFPLFEGGDGVGDAWPVHHIEKVYKKLGGDHARVVRYVLYSNEMGGWRDRWEAYVSREDTLKLSATAV